MGRLAVLVNPEETDIEIVARILEVIRVAAIKGRLLLGRKNKADIGVSLVTIKLIRAAFVKGDDVAAQPGLVFRFFLDLRDDRAPRLQGRVRIHRGFDRSVDPLGNIFDGVEDVELEIERALFFRLSFGVETLLQVVVFGAAQLLQSVGADVMIRDRQTIGGNEGAASAGVEAHARFLQMLEPLRRRIEMILLL